MGSQVYIAGINSACKIKMFLQPFFSVFLFAFLALSEESMLGLTELDTGLLWKFANVELTSGQVYSGQIVGVYDETKFMWNPTEFNTITIFSCTNATQSLASFSTNPGEPNSVFSLSNHDLVSISLVEQPMIMSDFRDYMRTHGHVFSHVPVEGEVWISQSWGGYHQWEDGRSNYAWDLGALNSDMMSYSHFGTRNTDFEVFQKTVILPMDGKVVTVVREEIDNDPDIDAAVELADHENGSEVDLEEKPQNMVELEIGGEGSPFLLRLLHLKQNSIPSDIQVGDALTAGTAIGEVGNSGTTYVPHLHVVFGFTNGSGRFWSLPVDWADVQHRILIPYSHGYEYGPYHHHENLYPKEGYCVTK